MKNYFILIIIVLIIIPSAFSQKKAFSIADLYKIKNVSSPVVSPDGLHIVFTLSEYNLPKGSTKTDIYIMNPDGTGIKDITSNDKNDYNPVWSHDNKGIYFISDKTETPELFYYNLDNDSVSQITNISTGVENPVISPNGGFVAFSTDVYPECGADDNCNRLTDSAAAIGPVQAYVADNLLFRHWTDYSAGKFTHIFIYDINNHSYKDLTTGKFVSPTFMLGGGIGYNFSPDSKELCFVSNHDPHPEASTNADLWIVPVTGGDPVNITVENKAWDGTPIYSPDGKYIAYRTQKIPGYESDKFRIALFNRSSKETKIITENFDNWINDFLWNHDSKTIFFTSDVEGYSPLFKIDIASGSITNVTEQKSVLGFDISPNGKFIYYTASYIDKPREIYLLNLTNDLTMKLTDFNKKFLEDVDVRPSEKMWIKSVGGKNVEVFIVKPHNFDPNKKYPLILNVHGGPQGQWMDSFRGDWQVYPGSGYIVAFPNPHGSTGFGQEFTAQISSDWGGLVFDDLMKITDSLETLPYVDKKRIGAMGWSYGGYMMNWFQAKTKRFKCLASMMGLFDLTSMWGSTEELWFLNWDLKGQPWNSDLYSKWSPSNYVKNFSTPTLIITGEKDYRVPYTQSIEYFSTLQTLGIDSRLIIFKNDGHWPSSVKSMPLYYDAHLDWFHKYLGGDPAPYDVNEMVKNLSFKEGK
ncbi:MAG: S9 family peptidase [Ignavibacteriaceae bacterium]|jgi:dipeptidyl aminopeptidase/acylaminoacyl peptidase